MADKAALEEEKAKLVAEMADMQKHIMSGAFDGEFEADKYYASDEMKEFKAKYYEKAKRVSDIANQIIRL